MHQPIAARILERWLRASDDAPDRRIMSARDQRTCSLRTGWRSDYCALDRCGLASPMEAASSSSSSAESVGVLEDIDGARCRAWRGYRAPSHSPLTPENRQSALPRPTPRVVHSRGVLER